MREPAIQTVAPGQRLASIDDFVLVHLATVAEAAVARAIFDFGAARGASGSLALLYFVERGGLGVPSADAREGFIQLSRTSAPYYAASTLVVPGGGLAVAAVHTFVGAVRTVSGGRLPLAVFGELPMALGWLRQSVPRATRLPNDDVIEALVARLRA